MKQNKIDFKWGVNKTWMNNNPAKKFWFISRHLFFDLDVRLNKLTEPYHPISNPWIWWVSTNGLFSFKSPTLNRRIPPDTKYKYGVSASEEIAKKEAELCASYVINFYDVCLENLEYNLLTERYWKKRTISIDTLFNGKAEFLNAWITVRVNPKEIKNVPMEYSKPDSYNTEYLLERSSPIIKTRKGWKVEVWQDNRQYTISSDNIIISLRNKPIHSIGSILLQFRIALEDVEALAIANGFEIISRERTF